MVLSALLKQCLLRKITLIKALSKHLKAMEVQITSLFDFQCGTFGGEKHYFHGSYLGMREMNSMLSFLSS